MATIAVRALVMLPVLYLGRSGTPYAEITASTVFGRGAERGDREKD